MTPSISIKELDEVILACDLDEHGLKVGDVGTVVHMHRGGGYAVEFMTLSGKTIAVVSLAPEQVRPIGADEIANARPVHSSG